MAATTWSDLQTKIQAISGDTTTASLTQFQQDMNIGYHRFDAAIARYFTRKQQFKNIVAGTQLYQTPVDAVRVSNVSVLVGTNFELPLIQIRSETEWRTKNIYTQSSSYVTHYFIYGQNQIGLWPKPAASITNGLRFVYQPQDVDMSKSDYTTGTVTISNGSTAVTGTTTVWTSAQHRGMWLSVTDGSDGNWYEIDAVNSNTTITLLTPYVGPSVSGATYRIGTLVNFPPEYCDVPMDYALSRYFEKKNNPDRAKYHLDKFKEAVTDAVNKYSSSSLSNVITDGDAGALDSNPWLWVPQPGS